MAKSRYKIVAQQTAISVLLSALTFAFGFVRVYFFSKHLSMEDFGMLSLLLSYSAFLLYIFTLGSFQYLFKRVNDGQEAKRSGLWSSLGLTVLTSFSVTTLCFLFSGPICSYLNISKFQSDFKLTVLATATTAIAVIFSFYHYGQGKNNFQNLLQFLRGSLWVIVSLFLSFFWNLTLTQILWIFNLSIFIVLLMATPWKEIPYLISFPIKGISFKPVLKYCIPLLPYFASVWGIPTIIRSQLNISNGPKDVALFSVAYNLMEIVFMFTSTITATLSPYFFSESGEKERPGFFYNIMLKYSFLLVSLILPFVYIVRFDIITLVTSHKYAPAGDFIPLLLLLPLLRILIIVFEQLYLKEAKTIFLGTLYGIAILFSLSLSALLIPKYSVYGAIYSSLGTYLLLFLCLFVKSARKVDYAFQKLMGIFGLTIVMWITVLVIDQFHFQGFLKALPVALVTCLGLLFFPIFDAWEKQKFLSLFKIRYVSK